MEILPENFALILETNSFITPVFDICELKKITRKTIPSSMILSTSTALLNTIDKKELMECPDQNARTTIPVKIEIARFLTHLLKTNIMNRETEILTIIGAAKKISIYSPGKCAVYRKLLLGTTSICVYYFFMKPMKISLLFLILLPAGLFAQNSAFLWEKALLIAESNKGWIPGKTVMMIEELKPDGEVKGWREITISKYLDLNSEIVEESTERTGGKLGALLKMGGNFLGNEDSDDNDDNDKENVRSAMGIDPFDRENEKYVTYSDTGETVYIGGQLCKIFNFSIEGDEDRIEGIACLETLSGALLKTTGIIEPLPAIFKNMMYEAYYEINEDNSWYQKEILMNIHVSILFIINIRVRTTISYYDYFRDPE